MTGSGSHEGSAGGMLFLDLSDSLLQKRAPALREPKLLFLFASTTGFEPVLPP